MRNRIKPSAGQESVWDYPRPAICEATTKHLKVIFDGNTLADTQSAYRVLETSHPPTYYIPPTDVIMARLRPTRKRSLCEWKGQARYFDVIGDSKTVAAAAWCYPSPTSAFRSMTNYIAFYPYLMDECFVGDERVQAQEGDFYGGWITQDVVGPFKGAPQTWSW